MLAHYLRLSWRHLWRNRSLNLISIGGLAVSLASGLIIFLVVNYLFSFDRYHPHMDRSYWIVTDVNREQVMPTDAAPRPLAEVLRRNYPFVECAVRLETFFGRTISVPDGKGGWAKKFGEARNICFTEPSYFDLFGIEWVSGDRKTALSAPNTIVLTERYAQKYFGTERPLGRTLQLDNRTNLTVTGTMKNPPANTQLRYDALVSYATIPVLEGPIALQDWQGLQAMCFVRLRKGAAAQQLQRVLPAIGRKYLPASEVAHFTYHALPLEDLNHERSGTAPRSILYVLIGIGVLLVIAGCINYVNLATARMVKRSHEIGVRKAVGGTRRQVVGQLLLETAQITLIAVLLALLLTQLTLPLINQTLASQVEMLSPDISLWNLVQPRAMLWFVSLVVSVIMLAGLYPALVLSGITPSWALAGRLITRPGKAFPVRQGLVVGQYVVAQLFLMGALGITAQLRYMQTVPWGFQHDNRLSVWLPQQGAVPLSQLRARWLSLPGVEQVSFGSDPPASPYNRPSPFSYHTATEPEPFETRVRAVDDQYLSVFGLTLLAGRNFHVTDTTGGEVLVNQTLVTQLGTTVQAIVGKRMRVKDADRTIVGVVQDFRSGNLHSPMLPVTLIHDLPHSRMAILTLAPNQSTTTLKAIQQVWDEVLPDQVYRADWLSDLLLTFAETERLGATLVQVFAGIAIGMSCLGLYGLVTFMAESKAKEIGVRRVLGARTRQLLWLFGREFGKLLTLGFLVAAPLGWWLLTSWLQSYAHRIHLNVWLLAATAGLTVVITSLTVLRQALKAAASSPIQYLETK
ncbi:ABC transporter permease [Spirosoma fluminis]